MRKTSSAPTPNKPCALVRVSTDEQAEQFSIPMQIADIKQYCAQELGVTLSDSDIFVEEGVSGRPGPLAKRPGLNAALVACSVGTYTHLIVHKIDRLGRNVGLMASALDTMVDYNIAFISVRDKVDASTPHGRLYIALFCAIAQWYSDNLSEETKKGKEGRKRAGLYNGALPFGYIRGEGAHAIPLADIHPFSSTGTDGIIRSTSNSAGLLTIFTLCAQGVTARAIATHLNFMGYRTTGTRGRNRFYKDTVLKILRNRFYLGELPTGIGQWVQGKHAPLVEIDLWDQAQDKRHRHRTNPQTIPGNTRPHVLGGGLLRCAYCSLNGHPSPLHITRSTKAPEQARYMCYGRIQGNGCTQPSLPEEQLEAQIIALFAAFSIPEAQQQVLLTTYQKEQEHPLAKNEGFDPQTRRAQLEAQLERCKDLYACGDWDWATYDAKKREVHALLEQLTFTEEPQQFVDVITQLSAYVREVKQAWQDADMTQRRQLVRTLFEEMWVQDERIIGIKPVPQFQPFFNFVTQQEGGIHVMITQDTPESHSDECHSGVRTDGTDGQLAGLSVY